jgi:NADPH-dependent curcumin reductase CurA
MARSSRRARLTAGLEGLPAALVGLLADENRGKRIVKVA